ncbi:MAG: 23S rRNA pseudouridine(2605) synthase RluB [Wenzhouxiangellaceae bacterium]
MPKNDPKAKSRQRPTKKQTSRKSRVRTDSTDGAKSTPVGADKAARSQPGEQAERLQKLLADAGLGSRRGLERHITAGEVLLNSKPAILGTKAKAGDRISFQQRQFRVESSALQARTLVYNKPEGELTTRDDPEGRRTVFDNLPPLKQGRWVAIGRLDINTSGLLLLTTDGELANAMMHPSSQIDREYVCRIWGEVTEEQLQQLRDGVMLEDGPAKFSDLQAATEFDDDSANRWFYAVLLEGRNREVRRLWNAVGATVSRLKRVRYGAVKLGPRDRVGQYRELSAKEHQILRGDVGLEAQPTQLKLVDQDPPRLRQQREQRQSRQRRDPWQNASPGGGKQRRQSPSRNNDSGDDPSHSRRSNSTRDPRRRNKRKP